MEEAVSLKTRDYLKNGLPVILNYYDTDVHNLKGIFYWQQSKTQLNNLLSFLDNQTELNAVAIKECIGMQSKMKKLHSFIE